MLHCSTYDVILHHLRGHVAGDMLQRMQEVQKLPDVEKGKITSIIDALVGIPTRRCWCSSPTSINRMPN